MPWKAIRKYKAGAGRLGAHNDRHNVMGLIAHAYAEHAEILAFLRDVDGDPDREGAIAAGLAEVSDAFAEEYRYELAVIAGMPAPCLEGWVLAMLGVHGTDAMSRAKVMALLDERTIEAKRLREYVEVLDGTDLDHTNAPSLAAFLASARGCLASVTKATRGSSRFRVPYGLRDPKMTFTPDRASKCTIGSCCAGCAQHVESAKERFA
jgi:hypothetical protein